MCKRKRFRKVLNIFLCVLSIMVVFSVTTFAVDGDGYVSAKGLKYTDGDITFEFEVGSQTNYDALYIYRESYIVYKVVDGQFEEVTSGTHEYIDRLYNRATGEYIDFVPVQNGKEAVMILVRGTDLHDYCDLVPIRNGDVLVYIQNFTEMVFGVVTDFSKIITENALMLLFAIGLPVCSLGVGFLIRLKERT